VKDPEFAPQPRPSFKKVSKGVIVSKAMCVVDMVTPKTAAELELLLNKLAIGLSSKQCLEKCRM